MVYATVNLGLPRHRSPASAVRVEKRCAEVAGAGLEVNTNFFVEFLSSCTEDATLTLKGSLCVVYIFLNHLCIILREL